VIVASVTAPGTRNATPLWRRVHNALTTASSQGARMASAARHRYRRPALAISGLACFDASAWHTFGTGAGLLVLGACLWAFELISGDE